MQPSRKSIRWAYDIADPSVPSTGQGGNDWFCERAWSDLAHTVPGSNRAEYQKEFGRNNSVLAQFLARRKMVVKRCLNRASKPKRRGGFMESLRYDLPYPILGPLQKRRHDFSHDVNGSRGVCNDGLKILAMSNILMIGYLMSSHGGGNDGG